MRRVRCLAACAAYLAMACVVPLSAAHTSTPDTEVSLTRGIAVLASSIGSDYSPECLAESVQQGKFSPVVIDWAWITAHWNRTNFPALSRFLELMAAENVPVAAMYRPRFLSQPTVPVQVDRTGRSAASHGYYICFASPEARQWGVSWGTRILQEFPQIDEIIVYNPLNKCQCPVCQEAAQGESYAHYNAVWRFLAEARAGWRKQRPGVKLGVVFVNDPEFWKRGSEVLDVAHPFLFVTDDTDLAKDAAAAGAIRDLLPGKMGSCLAKVTWGPNDKVSPARLAQFDRVAAAAGLPYFFWTFETLFASDLYDPKAVAIALGMGQPAAAASAATRGEQSPPVATAEQPKPTPRAAGAGEPGNLKYTPEQIRDTSAEVFLERMLHREPGYHQFAALQALTQKVKDGEALAQREMVSMVIAVMKDKSRPLYQRWQCCYVLSGSGAEQGVPDLIEVLLHDDSPIVRAVAAEALAKFPQSAAAHDALLQAAGQETSPRVREVLARRLGEEMPEAPSAPAAASVAEERAPSVPAAASAAEERAPSVPAAAPTVEARPPSVPVGASAVEERAPSGPPEPPPGPVPPVAKPLPWPFPGGQKDQRIFNNYQQPTDIYIHSGLDFIHAAGTPVVAVDSGYVAAIYTNYPDWMTHYFFIVTPERDGNEGWCYTHLDPLTFTFGEGDFVRQGQRLGTLVDFSVGDKPGVSHLHLHYVRFDRDASGKVNVHSLLDPLYFFDWEDTEPPVFQPLRFVTEDMAEQFPADAAGVVTVSGRADVLAAVTDSAYPGHMGNLGVPVVMLSISDGEHTMQKLVLDHRGDVGDERLVKPLYLSNDQKKAFLNPDSFPRYQMLRVTKTDGDGKIASRDVEECWDTTARDLRGRRLWPNGQYSVNVYAWDIAGNRGAAGAVVRVRNR